MTRTRLTLLLAPALPLATVLLALAACGSEPGEARERREAPAAPFGFELAMAGTAGAGVDEAAAAPDASPPLVTLTPEELAARIAAGNIRLIDVRTDAEVAEGIIPGAEHIPLDRFDANALGPDDGREVVLYCRSDRRSGIAAARLAEATGEPATHLEGGILAWEAAGQPVDKTP